MVNPNELIALAGELILVLRRDAALWLQEKLASRLSPTRLSFELQVL